METSVELRSREHCGSSMGRQIYSNCRFIEGSSVSKYKFIDIFYVTCGETCYPGTIDRGEHPAVNTESGQFKILGASWESNASILRRIIYDRAREA